MLVSRWDDVPTFDQHFDRFWSLQSLEAPSEPEPVALPDGSFRTRAATRVESQREEGPEAQGPPLVQLLRTGASPVEVLARRDLGALHGRELAEMSLIAAAVARALPSRPGRRRRPHRRKGVPDLRRAFRLNLSLGGEPLSLPRRRRAPRKPRFLVLLDVSGSMDRHARLLLQMAHCLAQRSGRVETFVFSTSLTRVTRELSSSSFPRALQMVGARVRQWSGGTRIGHCLETLNRSHPELLDQDTTVFLMSDGWETGDPGQLAGELSRLRRRVRRLIWLNPLLGTRDFAPLTLGLRAAAPHVDRFASALDLAHLRRLPRILKSM